MSKIDKINKKINRCTQVDHYASLRKRTGQVNFGVIDHVIVFSGPLIPLAVFVQAYNVWIIGKGEGLSLITWSLMLFASFTMAIYAVQHRVRSLMMVYIPLVLANALVVSGIVLMK